jgi:hypothetical protein
MRQAKAFVVAMGGIGLADQAVRECGLLCCRLRRHRSGGRNQITQKTAAHVKP